MLLLNYVENTATLCFAYQKTTFSLEVPLSLLCLAFFSCSEKQNTSFVNNIFGYVKKTSFWKDIIAFSYLKLRVHKQDGLIKTCYLLRSRG